jgi:hypothetical protein
MHLENATHNLEKRVVLWLRILLEENISYLTTLKIEHSHFSDSSAELAQLLHAPCANECPTMKLLGCSHEENFFGFINVNWINYIALSLLFINIY